MTDIQRQDAAPQPEKLSAWQRTRALIAQHYQNALDAKARGEKIGWVTSRYPVEIYNAFDITVIYPENHAAAVTARKGAAEMCSVAEGMGYSNDICSYARINFACVEGGGSEHRPIPMPDFLLLCNNICSQLTFWYQNLAEELDVPIVLFDVPYVNEPGYMDDDRYEYLSAQLEYNLRQLEEITGKSFDHRRWMQACELANACGGKWQELNRLLQHTPSPLNGMDLYTYMSLLVINRNLPEASDILDQLLDEVRAHIENGTSTYNKTEEKYRIWYDGIMCWPYLRHIKDSQIIHGINQVRGNTTNNWGTCYDKLRGMLAFYCEMYGCLGCEDAMEKRAADFEKYNIDGAVMHLNRSCKGRCSLLMQWSERMKEQFGIPCVIFDGDQSDPRCFSPAQYDTRLQALVEIMESKKKEAGK
jgi:benzoyl-CoA reductase/2-hydroxyglutaryl-CoA dehydratase subunit BcrC/BadD/HgdB